MNVVKIAPFVATFGMFYILDGVAYTYSVNPVGLAAPSFYNLYVDKWGGVPVILVISGAFWFLCWYVARQTALRTAPVRDRRRPGGRAPRRRPHGLVSISAYVLCAVIAALAGMLELTQTSVAAPDLGATLLLTTVTTVVIGGVSLFGGQGSVVGVLGGVLVISFLNQLFDTVQVNALYQQLIQGLIILAVLGIYRQRRRS